MFLSQDELSLWEEKLRRRNMNRMFKMSKHYTCPRKVATLDYRHHRGSKFFYDTECKAVRIFTVRRFRRKLKQQVTNEIYFRAHPHDYKTYGWETW